MAPQPLAGERGERGGGGRIDLRHVDSQAILGSGRLEFQRRQLEQPAARRRQHGDPRPQHPGPRMIDCPHLQGQSDRLLPAAPDGVAMGG